jgi:alkylation response protein AidB-like acyl-CoA dehydrogenase
MQQVRSLRELLERSADAHEHASELGVEVRSVGCARRALDQWVAFAKTKKRIPRGYANELHTVQRDLAFAHGEMRAAEAYVRGTFAELHDCAKRGHVPAELKLDGRLCASHATFAAARVTQTAFASCTTACHYGRIE